jgi:hypothetical protein
MTSRSPEVRHRSPNCSVVLVSVCVHIPGVCDFALGGRVYAVDLGGSQRLEGREAESFGQRVDSCVFEELVACLVNLWCIGVPLEVPCAWDFAGEVVAGVEELEEASNSVKVFVYEVNSTLLLVIRLAKILFRY